MARRIGVAVLGTAGLMLAGCATYAPRPLPASETLARIEASRLPAGGDWDGAALLEAGLARNPAVAKARGDLALARASAANDRLGPSLGLTLTAEYSDEAGGSSPWLAGAALDIGLEAGARRKARLTAADLAELKALYAYGEAVWAVRMEVARGRAESLAADREVALAAELLDLRRARAALAQRRVAAGEDDRRLALAAETDLSIAQTRWRAAVNRRAQAAASLGAALGASGLDAPAPGPPAPPPDPSEVAAWRREAALSRADVLAAVADYDLAETALRLEVARQYPEIRLGPGYTWERGVTKLPFTLSLALPPSGFNRLGIAQAEARRAQSGAALEAAQARVLAAVDQAWVSLEGAEAAHAQARTTDLRLAERAAAVAEAARRAGEGDRLDLLAAQAAAAEARLAEAGAQADLDRAVLALEDALRRPLDPVETAVLAANLKSVGVRP